jgi:predicted RND superfamily exporter protein
MEIVIIFILIVITSIITIEFLKLKQDYKLLLSNKNNFINNIEKLKNQIDILKNALYADVKVVVNNKVRNTYSVSSTGGYTSRIREKDKKVLKSGFKTNQAVVRGEFLIKDFLCAK